MSELTRYRGKTGDDIVEDPNGDLVLFKDLAALSLTWREPGVPKEAGYYWYRPDAEWEPWVVRLIYDKYGLPEIHWVQDDGTGVTQRGIEHCQFAGPLPSPREKVLPTIQEIGGSDPDFTGGMTTQEYLDDIRS